MNADSTEPIKIVWRKDEEGAINLYLEPTLWDMGGCGDRSEGEAYRRLLEAAPKMLAMLKRAREEWERGHLYAAGTLIDDAFSLITEIEGGAR